MFAQATAPDQHSIGLFLHLPEPCLAKKLWAMHPANDGQSLLQQVHLVTDDDVSVV
jgi:hypothetical protein